MENTMSVENNKIPDKSIQIHNKTPDFTYLSTLDFLNQKSNTNNSKIRKKIRTTKTKD